MQASPGALMIGIVSLCPGLTSLCKGMKRLSGFPGIVQSIGGLREYGEG
jgi:hypothetical protein